MLAGWITALGGQTAEAQRWAGIVDAASFDLVPLDGSASFDSARAMWRAFMCAAGPEQMMIDASYALAEEPRGAPGVTTRSAIAGEAQLLAGDVDQAAALFRESSVLAAANSNTDSLVVSEAELALLAMDRGQWVEAGEHLELALDEMDEHGLHDYATCILAFAAGGPARGAPR